MPEPDDLLFPDEGPAPGVRLNRMPGEERWKLLVVDDEEEVHHVTRLVLAGFRYAGRGLEFLSAHSARQAREVLAAHPDVAVILLDVVMEEHDSGLTLVRHIREELKNRFVRIILRTGQPGHAPEAKVIVEYDINDYKEKTEITAQKLMTAMVSSLRTYCDIRTIEANRRGLEKILEASADIFAIGSLERFASGVLTQLLALLSLGGDALYGQAPGLAAAGNSEGMVIKAACGRYSGLVHRRVEDIPDEDVRACIAQSLTQRHGRFCRGKSHVEYFESVTGTRSVIYFEEFRPLTDLDRQLVDIFFANVSVAFDNIALNIKAEEKALLAEKALRLAEKASLEALRQNQQRIESLQKISRAVAHQLRNPVTIIAGMANLLRKKPGRSESEAEYLEGIAQAAVRIEAIARTVVEFNSLRLGSRVPVPLPLFLEEVRAAGEMQAAEQGKTVDWMVEAEPLAAPLDRGLVALALAELVANSLEALEGPRGWIGLSASRKGDFLRLAVQDNGRGIPPAELDFVLDPFYSTKTVGVGLGLPRAERIAQEHGGTLSVSSPPGQGTLVEMLLPLPPE
jgi:signal transduction histidine kinase